MIDLHAHIVPGVDDGARSLSDSLEMARMAAKSGVTILAATSHGEFAPQGPGGNICAFIGNGFCFCAGRCGRKGSR